jgi:Protein of unknown function (DUF2971)
MNSAPLNLYKYLPSDRASSVLAKLQIRFSQVSVMNDAMEFKPPIQGVAARPRLEQVIEERFRVLYPGQLEQIEQMLPSQKAQQLIKASISKTADLAELNLEKSIATIYEVNDRNFGILSLSEEPTSLEMWERYADNGQGFLIEFDPAHPWFWAKIEQKDDLRHLRRVSYLASRPDAYLLDTTGQDYLYTKERKWGYEKEWRIIRNFNDAAINAGPDNKGKDVLLFAIPPTCVRRVVAGYHASSDSIERNRQIIAANAQLSHVVFSKVRLREDGSVEIVSAD